MNCLEKKWANKKFKLRFNVTVLLLSPYIFKDSVYWFSLKSISLDSNETNLKWWSSARVFKNYNMSNHDVKKIRHSK